MKKQLLRVLLMSGKLSIYILLIKACLLQSLLAFDASGQYKSVHEVKIQVNLEEAGLKEVISQIENQTDYVFQYFNKDIKNSLTLTLRNKNISVADLLYTAAEKFDLKFRQVNNSIAVAKVKKGNANRPPIEVVEAIQVSGKVLDENNEGLPGASVVIKGTTNGTITGVDGAYSLLADEKDVLIFSFVGYNSEEVAIQGRSNIDILLVPDITSLEEVVIVGYSSTKRRSLTESISVIETDKIENVPLASFDNILQGAATGVQVASGGGQPGSGVAVRIRGNSSITGGNAPLYVIDGVPINVGSLTEDAQTGNAFANINPNDIASITILKDASATSIYGSRGTNGVVLITTKQGKSGKSKIRLSTQYGFSDFENPNDFGVMNANEFTQYMREATINSGIDPDAEFLANGSPNPDFFPLLGENANLQGTDWVDEVIQTGIIQRYDVSVSGGSDKTKYFTSLGYYDEEGIVRQTDFRRISARFNLQHEIDKRASLGVNLTITDARQTNRQGAGTTFRDPIYGSFFISPLEDIRASEEQIANGGDFGTGFNFDIPGFAGHNTVASLALNSNGVQTFRTIGNVFFTYDILENLSFRTSFGIDRADLREDEFLSPNYERGRSGGAETEGSAIANSITEFDWVSTSTLTYNQEIFDGHNLNVLLGNEVLQSVTERNRAVGAGFASDKLQTINSAARPDAVDTDYTMWNLASFFLKVNYDLDNKYFLSLSARRDGSSRFGPDNRWGNFWSVGAGYLISEENFMSALPFIDFLKIKAGVGTQGNNSIGNFAWLTSYSFTSNLNLNGQTVSGSRPGNLGDRSVSWESQFTADVGIEMSLFNRFKLDVNYYRKTVDDMLFEVPLSRTTGFNDIQTNAGGLRNSGVEVEFTSTNIKNRDFEWVTSFQFSANENEITDIPEADEFIAGETINREGEPVNSWFLPRWAGVDPATGKPLWFDANNNVTDDYGSAEFIVAGRQLPRFFGSFSNNISYKGVSLSASFYYNYGNDVYREVQRFLSSDGARFGRNQDRTQLARWQRPGDVTDVPRISKGNGDGGNNHSTRYLEDGSFIKLRSVTLSYNLPQEWLSAAKIGNVRVYAQGLNLMTWTNFRGLDPETGIGSLDFGEYPNPRKILFGLDIEF